MRLLLISNSTNAGEAYLDYPKFHIRDFLGSRRLNCVFLPFAGVTVGYDDYEARVKQRFEGGTSVI
jgi:dipeptidase E